MNVRPGPSSVFICGSSKRQQPYRPHVSAVAQHRRCDLPGMTFIDLPAARSHRGDQKGINHLDRRLSKCGACVTVGASYVPNSSNSTLT